MWLFTTTALRARDSDCMKNVKNVKNQPKATKILLLLLLIQIDVINNVSFIKILKKSWLLSGGGWGPEFNVRTNKQTTQDNDAGFIHKKSRES